MRCGRCGEKKEIRYRVFSVILDMKVCAGCAADARGLHLGIELLQQRDNAQTDEYVRKAS
jgi:hypothetical protein